MTNANRKTEHKLNWTFIWARFVFHTGQNYCMHWNTFHPLRSCFWIFFHVTTSVAFLFVSNWVFSCQSRTWQQRSKWSEYDPRRSSAQPSLWSEVSSCPPSACRGHHWFRRGAGRLFKNNQPILILPRCERTDRRSQPLERGGSRGNLQRSQCVWRSRHTGGIHIN